tara:strand:- start:7621 stop:8229 length:609 start_codon:yes stop_codon:yes gene_type:complete
MKLKNIKENIYQVDFSSREELLKTFIRFQEYYESPEFKGKDFSVEEYAEWYKENYNKEEFTYYSDWSGCNVPSYIFKDFRNGKISNLSEREKSLLDCLPKEGDFYVIGTFDGGKKYVIEHETCHGLYFTDAKYRNRVLTLLEDYESHLKEVKDFVLNLGYHEDVLLDEVHAYIATTSHQLDEKGVCYPKDLVEKLRANANLI